MAAPHRPELAHLASRVVSSKTDPACGSGVRFVAWVLLLLLALFPVLAAIADLASDFGAGLPTDHQPTFAALAGQAWSTAQASAAGVTSFISLLETGYAIHELVLGPWWLAWVVLVADLGYTLTFGRYDATVFSRALIADVALPLLLLAQLPWLLSLG